MSDNPKEILELSLRNVEALIYALPVKAGETERAPLEAWAQRLRNAISAAVPNYMKDALRYRFLRERDLDTITKGGIFAGKTPDNIVLNGVDLDHAIDAARSIPHDEPQEDEAEKYRAAAKRLHHREGRLEIDEGAVVSMGDDPGAYVQAWVWVDDDELQSGEEAA